MHWTLGDIRVDLLTDGHFRLDGGAMFGVVPKPMWSRTIEPDDRNRIRLALHCLLIRSGAEVVLVDTGIGGMWSEKNRDIYAIEHDPGLVASLAALGVAPEDVTRVINTHLHFDHAGGNTVERNGTVVPAFPKATYYVQRGEYEWALAPTLRDRASYLSERYVPVTRAGKFELLEGDTTILDGLRTWRRPGHCPHLQSVLIEGGGKTLFFPSDCVATSRHLPWPWVMGFDLEPLVAMQSKMEAMRRAADEGWIVVFQHDGDVPAATIEIHEDRPIAIAHP